VTEAITSVLGENLIGLYLYGSCITGDFDENVSDIDLLAVLHDDLREDQLGALALRHDAIKRRHAQWDDRVEVVYISGRGLANFRDRPSPAAVISPGEPFHAIEAGDDWLITWYPARLNGVPLIGPPADEVIPPISRDEYVESVRKHMRSFPSRVAGTPALSSLAYAILTMCRGLYTVEHGEQVSKLKAAAWAERRLPEWSGLIRNALLWRRSNDKTAAPPAVVDQARRFVQEAGDMAR
jgi:predicted nucleotidyltransferase